MVRTPNVPMRTHSLELGERIKKLRLGQNLTLKELEAKAGVSATHLSEIERGLTSPTIGALARVAHALGEEPALLVCEHAGHRVAVARCDQRREFHTRGTTFRPIGGPMRAEMSVIEIELPADGAEATAPTAGRGEEFVLILSGDAELTRGDATYQLTEGDAIHYGGNEPWALRSRGGQAARALWIALPAISL
jgi:transcriptional regulator with XRE-family HTH domain